MNEAETRLNRQPYGGEPGRRPWGLLLSIGITLSAGGGFLLRDRFSDRWCIDMPSRIYFSSLVAFLGLALLVVGGKAWRDSILRKRRDASLVGQPWELDHEWDKSGAVYDPAKKAWSVFQGAFGVSLFTVLLGLIARGEGGIGVLLFVTLGMSGVVIGLFGYVIYLLIRRAKYGVSRLRFPQCPFLLGQRLDVELLCERPIGQFKFFKATLRCIQERVEQHRDNTSQVCYQIYGDTINVEAGEEFHTRPLPITFLLPDKEILRTRLSASPPCYWELEVEAKTSGVNYGATFLIPVYSTATTHVNGHRADRRVGAV